MQTTAPDYRKYLDPTVLAKIHGLELRARLIIEGFIAGMHHSPRHGLSVEFADHRIYSQGDDLRHMDWKIFGRTDKYYIKEYEQESNLNLVIVVDASESMDFNSTPSGLSKHEYAAALAAAIAYLTLQQHDSVGLALFDERLRHYLRPSNHLQHWRPIVHELDARTGPAKTSLAKVLNELAERLSHRVMILLISDLFDDIGAALRAIQHLRYRRHELIVWNLWDPAELSFSFRGPTLFDGLESTGKMLVDPGALRSRYLEEVERFQGRWRTACGQMRVDYSIFNTAMPLDTALSGYLATRSARLRLRSSRVVGAG